MLSEFTTHLLPNGIRLNYLPTAKFKTISMGLFIHQELNRDLAARNALLPAVLEQGCRPYPDYLSLQRALEDLYGSALETDIIKSGERHIMAFTCEMAHQRYLGEEDGYFGRGLGLLGSVVTDPLLVDGVFREDYVNQEKTQLTKDIRALLNDKAAYAYQRCLALMCARENFGVYKLGRVEDYEKLNAADLYSYYRRLLAANPIDLYLIGDLEELRVVDEAAAVFDFPRDPDPLALAPTVNGAAPPVPVTHEEEMALNQAKLVIGYRTNTSFTDPLHCALLLYSGLLGGFPHSRLFLKVREEASLAYYIHSRLERHKGLMIIAAGINSADYPRVREIIDAQMASIASGDIGDAELEHTRRGLVNRLQSQQDSPGRLISSHLDGTVGGRAYRIDELIEGIEEAGREEIAAVAGRIRPDTFFLLRPGEGDVSKNDH